MNLLVRLVRFLAVAAFKLLVRLIAVLVRLFLPVFFSLLRMLRGMVFTSLTATVNGPGQYTDRLASQWTQQILELGIPRDNIDQIYSLCYFLVAARILLGWLIAALITLVILRIVFDFVI